MTAPMTEASPPLRLIYLSLETPREGQATHTHVHEIINGLRADGFEVELIATSRGGASSGSSYLTRLIDYAGAQWRMVRRLSWADAVFMRSHFAALPASLWARARSRPVFQEINGKPADIAVTYPWLTPARGLLDALYAWQMRLAAHVFVVTEGLRGWALAQGRHGRVSVVSNGANTKVFSPDGPASPVDGRYVAFVGGLTAWHGIGVMLAAVRDPAWPAGVRLVIAGDGVERAQLVGLPADGPVLWLGRRPQIEAAAVLRGALAALSITQDSVGHLDTGVAPLKLFEAMASGAPVIVTDLPGQRDLIAGLDAGVVIPMGDPAALARAVAELAADPAAAQAKGRRGATFVVREASWEARAREVGAVIRQALGRGGQA